MWRPLSLLLALLALGVGLASAQFDFFENIFQGQQQFHQGHSQQQQQQQHPQAPSDSDWYQRVWGDTFCDLYLCPNSLACVSVPEHCPCQHPRVEDKVELGDGIAVCANKGGFKAGEMARKVELARKGML